MCLGHVIKKKLNYIFDLIKLFLSTHVQLDVLFTLTM